MPNDQRQRQALLEDIKAYKKLEKINSSQEFNDFFQVQITTVVQKMLQCFSGQGPANWDEFCKIRGEVIGMLYPIQEVRGAKIMASKLQEQLDTMYNQPV